MHPENEQSEQSEQSEFSAIDDAMPPGSDEPARGNDVSSVALEESARNALETNARDAPESIVAARAEPAPDREPEQESGDPEPADALSPAVRRLVRQYDLDITGIHGTGPSGRIRVGDVIGILGARTDASARAEAAGGAPPDRDAGRSEAAAGPTPSAPSAATPVAGEQPVTTVFECDLSRVVSHRKQLRNANVEILLTSYYLVACAEAHRAVPEILARDGGDAASGPRFGVLLESADGELRSTLVDASAAADGSLDDRLRALDRALRASGEDDLGAAELTVHHYGMSGSLLATPLPLGANRAPTLGIGRVQRRIVMKATDGEDAPRVAAVCYVTVTFAPERIALQRANRFLAHVVAVLERWPG